MIQLGHVVWKILVLVFGVLFGLVCIWAVLFEIPPNRCQSLPEFPVYSEIPVSDPNRLGYKLFRVEDSRTVSFRNQNHKDSLRKQPVLFVHGHFGSFSQARHLAADYGALLIRELQDEFLREEMQISENFLEFYTVDFHESSSGFHASILKMQAEFLSQCIREVFEIHGNSPVWIIGHSMGGITARAALVLATHVSNSVSLVLTLNTPHQSHPIVSDHSWKELYWSLAEPFDKIVYVSITGGIRDIIIRPDLCELQNVHPEDLSIFVFSSSMSGVWVPIDHDAILWCRQMQLALLRTFWNVFTQKPSSPYHLHNTVSLSLVDRAPEAVFESYSAQNLIESRVVNGSEGSFVWKQDSSLMMVASSSSCKHFSISADTGHYFDTQLFDIPPKWTQYNSGDPHSSFSLPHEPLSEGSLLCFAMVNRRLLGRNQFADVLVSFRHQDVRTIAIPNSVFVAFFNRGRSIGSSSSSSIASLKAVSIVTDSTDGFLGSQFTTRYSKITLTREQCNKVPSTLAKVNPSLILWNDADQKQVGWFREGNEALDFFYRQESVRHLRGFLIADPNCKYSIKIVPDILVSLGILGRDLFPSHLFPSIFSIIWVLLYSDVSSPMIVSLLFSQHNVSFVRILFCLPFVMYTMNFFTLSSLAGRDLIVLVFVVSVALLIVFLYDLFLFLGSWSVSKVLNYMFWNSRWKVVLFQPKMGTLLITEIIFGATGMLYVPSLVFGAYLLKLFVQVSWSITKSSRISTSPGLMYRIQILTLYLSMFHFRFPLLLAQLEYLSVFPRLSLTLDDALCCVIPSLYLRWLCFHPESDPPRDQVSRLIFMSGCILTIFCSRINVYRCVYIIAVLSILLFFRHKTLGTKHFRHEKADDSISYN
jgi:hypothetical protein